jgi:hypothetical protein
VGYLNKTFFGLLLGLLCILLFGLAFVAEVTADHQININTATSEDLDSLPGVGPATAQSIIIRVKHGWY